MKFNKYSLTAGKVDSGHDRPTNQLREGVDQVQADHPILEVLPEGDALFAASLFRADGGIATSSPDLAADPSINLALFDHVPQVSLAAVVVDR